VPELPGPVDRLVAAPCSGSTKFLVTVRQQPSQNVGAGGNGNASRSPVVVPAVTGLGDLRLTHESTRRG
jgi:hypothetical protein